MGAALHHLDHGERVSDRHPDHLRPLLRVGSRDYFGASVGGFWLSYSLYELSAYVGDARSKDLPLVGFASSEDLEHDWGYLLGALHMLPADHFFAFVLRMLGLAAGVGSCAFAVWLLITMARSRNARGFV